MVDKEHIKAKRRLLKESWVRNLQLGDSESESYDKSQLCDDDELDDMVATQDTES